MIETQQRVPFLFWSWHQCFLLVDSFVCFCYFVLNIWLGGDSFPTGTEVNQGFFETIVPLDTATLSLNLHQMDLPHQRSIERVHGEYKENTKPPEKKRKENARRRGFAFGSKSKTNLAADEGSVEISKLLHIWYPNKPRGYWISQVNAWRSHVHSWQLVEALLSLWSRQLFFSCVE